MDIGKALETVVVEPIESPVPGDPIVEPGLEQPQELPLEEPALKPVSV